MISTFEAWRDNRPIFNRLPASYRCNVIADWLCAPFDILLAGLKAAVIDGGARQVNPRTCDEDWLDYLASLCGWHGYWDRAWPIQAKRELLAASYTFIWPKYGTLGAMSFVLTALGIKHLIQEGQAFIIGREKVGDPLGAAAWQYQIILPTDRFKTDEHKTTLRINDLFGPIWCKSEILFTDDFFEVDGFLSLGNEAQFFAVDGDGTLLRL